MRPPSPVRTILAKRSMLRGGDLYPVLRQARVLSFAFPLFFFGAFFTLAFAKGKECCVWYRRIDGPCCVARGQQSLVVFSPPILVSVRVFHDCAHVYVWCAVWLFLK